jgi:hypothetical protein
MSRLKISDMPKIKSKQITTVIMILFFQDTYVDPTVESLISQVKKLKPKFQIKHGSMMRFADPYVKIVRPHDAWMGDPLTLLLRYMSTRNMRLMDLFSQFDTDDSWTLTISEFKKGVKVREKDSEVVNDGMRSMIHRNARDLQNTCMKKFPP